MVETRFIASPTKGRGGLFAETIMAWPGNKLKMNTNLKDRLFIKRLSEKAVTNLLNFLDLN
jgi:hypothetical protein